MGFTMILNSTTVETFTVPKYLHIIFTKKYVYLFSLIQIYNLYKANHVCSRNLFWKADRGKINIIAVTPKL